MYNYNDVDATARGLWMRTLGANKRFIDMYAGFTKKSAGDAFFRHVQLPGEKARQGKKPELPKQFENADKRVEAGLFYGFFSMLTGEQRPDIKSRREEGLLAYEMTSRARANAGCREALNMERHFMIAAGIHANVVEVQSCRECGSFALSLGQEFRECPACKSADLCKKVPPRVYERKVG